MAFNSIIFDEFSHVIHVVNMQVLIKQSYCLFSAD